MLLWPFVREYLKRYVSDAALANVNLVVVVGNKILGGTLLL